MNDDAPFVRTLVGDGRPLLHLTGLILIGCGVFVFFQAATGHFLPQDTDYLGMSAKDLCALHGCRIVHFMIHDRVSFGGVLVAIGTMYLWLTEFPLRRGERWAWWAIVLSAGAGFLSFLAYLGYGYLDSWHGAATLALLPVFGGGVLLTRKRAAEPVPLQRVDLRCRRGLGRAFLLASTFGLTMAGLTIMGVGMTSVFVPTDLEFMGVSAAEIVAINPRLTPLIAHDRAGFGGALLSCGLAMFIAVLRGRPSRSLTQALLIAGVAGFGSAILVHPAIGYTSVPHLGPAVFGALIFFAGLAMSVSPVAGEARPAIPESL